ncbi:MAG: ATPase [Phenylobacterium sp.]|nr:ATPase [Phenylobacterium sp.]
MTRTQRLAGMTAFIAMMGAAAAQAEVVETGPSHFRLRSTQPIAASPARVYEALGEVGRWWSDAHTYSGTAANMTMPLKANACFCETLPNGGSVRHGVVALAWPDQGMVRVEAALGPLQDEGVTAALYFHVKAKDGGSELVMTYNVGGARPAMVAAAPVIDGVLVEQATRLKRYLETGRP